MIIGIGAGIGFGRKKLDTTHFLLGAEKLVNGAFATDTNWAKSSGTITISGGTCNFTSTPTWSTITQSGALTANKWYLYACDIVSITYGGVIFGAYYGRTALGSYKSVVRTSVADVTLTGALVGSNQTFSVDNLSVKEILLNSLIFNTTTGNANATVSGNITATPDYPVGLICNLDSETNPKNFVIAYTNYNNGAYNLKLEKCVAGIYTTLINTTISYAAGRLLEIVKSGTSYTLRYNGSQVGTTQTVSDSGIINNTKHAVFRTNANVFVNNFAVV